MNEINQLTDLLQHGIEYKRKLADVMRSGDELSRLHVVRRNIPEVVRSIEYFERLLQPVTDEIARGDKQRG